MTPFLLYTISFLFVTDAFVLNQQEIGKAILTHFEAGKEDSFEDDEFIIDSSTTENSKDLSRLNFKHNSEDDAFIDDPFIVHSSTREPSLIHHAHDISLNSWKKDNKNPTNKAVKFAPSPKDDYDDDDYDDDDYNDDDDDYDDEDEHDDEYDDDDDDEDDD
ncbi:hypothetical protein J6590_027071 [Homalodisca vitripennis]|nr:hypothetical protein J6590_027071 [Homalodisca vitripennis]